MQLELSKDVEASIQAKAAAAGFQSVEAYILDRLDLNHEPRAEVSFPQKKWLQKFDAFVGNQVSRNPTFDDSRESIYPVR